MVWPWYATLIAIAVRYFSHYLSVVIFDVTAAFSDDPRLETNGVII